MMPVDGGSDDHITGPCPPSGGNSRCISAAASRKCVGQTGISLVVVGPQSDDEHRNKILAKKKFHPCTSKEIFALRIRYGT